MHHLFINGSFEEHLKIMQKTIRGRDNRDKRQKWINKWNQPSSLNSDTSENWKHNNEKLYSEETCNKMITLILEREHYNILIKKKKYISIIDLTYQWTKQKIKKRNKKNKRNKKREPTQNPLEKHT